MTAKYATAGVFGKLLRDPHFWAPAVATGAGAVVTGAAMAVHKLTDAKAQAKNYKEMLDLHPQLKTRDPAMVRRIYSSLHNVNPMMARDPMVAGGWVDNIMESGGLEPRLMSQALIEGVKDLAQIRSQMSQAAGREGSGARNIGAAVSRQIEHGFGRARELEREIGEVGALKKQVVDLQESRIQERANARQQSLAKAFGDVAGRIEKLEQKGTLSPQQTQQIIAAVMKKHSSAKTPGQRLIAACSRG